MMATVPLKTINILTMLVINKVIAREVICDDMMTDTKGIGHLNVKYSEGIQLDFSGYAKGTPEARRSTVTRVQQKRLISLMYWVKDKHRLKEPTEFYNIHNGVTLRSEIKASHKKE